MQIYYAQYNQMTDFDTEYVFFKDNRLGLVGECLFAKTSTAIAVLQVFWAKTLHTHPGDIGNLIYIL